MQEVSNKWKMIFDRPFTNRQFVEIEIKLTDPTLLNYCTITTNQDSFDKFRNKENQTSERLTKELFKTPPIKRVKYLELSSWDMALDGNSFNVIEDKSQIPEYLEFGWRAKPPNDANTVYYTSEEEPILTLNFSKVINTKIPGLTIYWDDNIQNVPNMFTVTWYKDQQKINSFHLADMSEIENPRITQIDDILTGFDKIEIRIHSMYAFGGIPRITHLNFGKTVKYTIKDLTKVNYSKTISPINENLPTETIEFSLENTDNKINLLEVDDLLSNYLTEQQKITIRYGLELDDGTIEYIKMATLFLSEWTTDDKGLLVNFKASDILSFMNNKYIQGVYGSHNLYNLAKDVLENAKLKDETGKATYYIDEELKNFQTMSPIPIISHAEALQLIAQSVGAIIYFDIDGYIHMAVEKTPSLSDFKLTKFNTLNVPEIELIPKIKQLEYNVYSYAIDANQSELFNDVVYLNKQIDTVEIIYSGLAKDVNVNVTNANVLKQEIYSKACRLRLEQTDLSQPVRVVVRGIRINESSTKVINQLDEVGLTQEIDNILITNLDLQRQNLKVLKTFFENRKQFKVELRYDPRINVGDYVDLNINAYSFKTMLLNVDVTFGGMFKGSVSGRFFPEFYSIYCGDDLYTNEVDL